MQRWLKDYDVKVLKKVVMPVDLGSAHWILAVVEINDDADGGCIKIFDAMGSGLESGKNAAVNLRWFFCRFWGSMPGYPSTVASSWVVNIGGGGTHFAVSEDGGVPLQQNSIDCGLYAYLAAEYLCIAQSSLEVQSMESTTSKFGRAGGGLDVVRWSAALRERFVGVLLEEGGYEAYAKRPATRQRLRKRG
jgi:hypothetical protein